MSEYVNDPKLQTYDGTAAAMRHDVKATAMHQRLAYHQIN